MIFAEFSRAFNIWPLGELMRKQTSHLLDRRDGHVFAMSHIYLMLACIGSVAIEGYSASHC